MCGDQPHSGVFSHTPIQRGSSSGSQTAHRGLESCLPPGFPAASRPASLPRSRNFPGPSIFSQGCTLSSPLSSLVLEPIWWLIWTGVLSPCLSQPSLSFPCMYLEKLTFWVHSAVSFLCSKLFMMMEGEGTHSPSV